MKDIAFRLGTPYANEFVRFARAFINPKWSLDSLMDIAGYAACAAEVGGLLSQEK